MNLKKIVAATLAGAMCINGVCAIAATVGERLWLGDFSASATETQKLIDERPDTLRQMENLDRGVVSIASGSNVFVSWRWLGTESLDVKFNVYRDGQKLNDAPISSTNFTDINPTSDGKYSVSTVISGSESEKSDSVAVWQNGYLDVPLQKPDDYTMGDGTVTNYSPGDASVADLDGDGAYEIILKWDPRHVKDASKVGYTGECVIDAYEMDGTRLWRIHMGKNIRSGPHDTQFIVYDFDNDGKAEMAVRTADGTVAGDGTVIGDAKADWAALNDGKNLQGPLYLTVFNGADGTVMDTIDYEPQTVGDGWDCTDWGDGYGNRSERYLASLGSVDGIHTSFQMARGYYSGSEGPLKGRTAIVSYHVENKKIVKDWTFDTKELENKYRGEGNHSMSTADIDYDGKDEIIFGALTIDHDGKVMYSTKLGHGDSQHVGDLLPSRPGLEVYSCHESGGVAYGYEMRDARTGEILFGEETKTDNGRAATADIDPDFYGEEMWSAAGVLTSADGTVISTSYAMPANYSIWWDGDLGREIQDGITVSKWNKELEEVTPIFRAENCKSINAAKSNPSLTADILGDWREETIYPTKDGNSLRIFSTTDMTNYRIPTLMHDTQYRNHVALQNVCYNQPTHTSFYLGYDTDTIPVSQMCTVVDGKQVKNADLAKKSWKIDDLYQESIVEMVVDCPTAVINGETILIDEKSADVAPQVNADNRTMVPLRFIAQSLGADVAFDETTRMITITNGTKIIVLSLDTNVYTVDGKENKMDTQPTITDGRTLVPVRVVAQAFDKVVGWNDGYITVSDNEISKDATQAKSRLESIKKAPTPVKKETIVEDFNNRLEIKEITADEGVVGDVKNINDKDAKTFVEIPTGAAITVDLGTAPGVPGVAVTFADDKEHTFKIEHSGDGKKWNTTIEKATFNRGMSEYKKYIFGCPQYPRYIRFVAGDSEPCKLSEFAVLGVE